MATGPMERVSGDDSPHAADIGRDALAVMVRQVPPGVLGTYVAAVLLVGMSWSGGHHAAKVAWLVAALATETFIGALGWMHHRNPLRFDVARWTRWFLVPHVALGLLWGTAMLLRSERLGASEQVLLVLVLLCANSAGAVVAFSSLRSLAVGFLGPMWSAAVVILVALGHYPLALGAAIFAGILVTYCSQAHRALHEALALRYRTAALADRLHRSEAMARSVVETAAEAIWTTDRDGSIRFANPAAAALLAAPADDVVGRNLIDHMPGLVRVVDRGEGTQGLETTVVGDDGGARAVIVSAGLVDADGSFTVMARDISERKALERRLAYEATHDKLTGLPNRTGFFEHASRVMQSGPVDSDVGLLFIDLDRFKQVNDVLGHQAGDLLLVEAGRRLRAQCRDSDLVARLGGDEFVLLLPNPPDRRELEDLGARLILALERPFQLAGDEARISASVGIARFRSADTTPEALLANADVAMYRAKQNGRRQVTFFDEDLQRIVEEHLDLEQAFRRAVAARELEAWGQPIVDLRRGVPVGVELLARWRRPGIGLVAPGAFIPVAEETGLVTDLGRWAIDQAAVVLRQWAGDPVLAEAYASVNVSCRHLLGGELADDLDWAIRRHGLDPARLLVELTESELARDLELARMTLSDVRALGVGVAIDDFGTGYSSLAYLQDLPATVLKVDRSFVTRLAEDRRQQAIVRAVVELAGAFGQKVIVEGIETRAQADAALRLDARYGQGYRFGRPMQLGELAEHLGAMAPPAPSRQAQSRQALSSPSRP